MVHDAQVYLSPRSYSRGFRLWYRLALPVLGRRNQRILTVSAYSREQIARFGIAPREAQEAAAKCNPWDLEQGVPEVFEELCKLAAAGVPVPAQAPPRELALPEMPATAAAKPPVPAPEAAPTTPPTAAQAQPASSSATTTPATPGAPQRAAAGARAPTG